MATLAFSRTDTSQHFAALIRHEVSLYAGETFEGRLVANLDDNNKVYSVIAVPNYPREYPLEIVVMAQVIGDKVIIVEDRTDKPLVEALMVNAKIPREQIILEYAGEKLPEQTKGN